jgi:predicted permease
MGARPAAIQRQLLVESGMIALVSGIVGAGIALAAIRAIRALLPVSISHVGGAEIDWRVLAFTLLTSVLVALVCGFAPAWRAASNAIQLGLGEARRASTTSRRARRFHDVLVVAELAVAIVLSATAGLLINSYAHVMRIDPGFRTSHVLRAKITLGNAYPRGPRSARFFETVLREARALPGVERAGYVNRFPLRDGNVTSSVIAEGAPVPADNQYPSADFRVASDGYFETMHIPLIAGRLFAPLGAGDSTLPVVILNRTAAMTFFHSTNVIGKRLQLTNTRSPFITVIGVVGDVRDASLRQPPTAQLFLSAWQSYPTGESLVVEYRGSPQPVLAGVRRVVASLDRTLPLYDVTTVEETIAAASVGDRFTMTLLTAFAVLALLLAAIGTYSVIAYGVAQRTKEIGVRIALGARAGEVLVMIAREGMLLFAMALPIALIAAWWAARAIGGLLFDVAPGDPTTIGLGVAVMAATTAFAVYVPARRAARVDAVTALRDG